MSVSQHVSDVASLLRTARRQASRLDRLYEQTTQKVFGSWLDKVAARHGAFKADQLAARYEDLDTRWTDLVDNLDMSPSEAKAAALKWEKLVSQIEQLSGNDRV